MPAVKVILVGDESVRVSGCVYYPLWFIRASVSWKRLLMSPRTEHTWICVDAVRGVAHRVDILPPSREIDVAEENVLPLGISKSDALDKAKSLARWWGRSRLFSWWAPAIKLEDEALLHKIYVVGEDSSGLVLRDSVSGESAAL
jgi:hypothetical protein